MGLDYSFELYFPRDKLWDVLESVAALQKPIEGASTEIVLPERTLQLPFTSRLESGTIIFDASVERLEFDTALYFSMDEPLATYNEETRQNFASQTPPDSWEPSFDEQGRCAVGYIYLFIHLRLGPHEILQLQPKPDVICFTFAAATTNMSILFRESPSIHRTFMGLLEAHDGIAAYFDDESGFGPILWPPHLAPDNTAAFNQLLYL